MKKIEIVEIENSYFNFFTPALICALGLFLIFLIRNSLLLTEWVTTNILSIKNLNVNYIVAIMTGIIVSLVCYFLLIPRLKVGDADYKKPTQEGLILVSITFCFILALRILIEFLYKIIGLNKEFCGPWFVQTYSELEDPFLFVLFLCNQLIINGLVSVLIYQRIVIPLLEDRGLSPFHAVIITAIAYASLNLPTYLQIPNFFSNIFWFLSTFLFSIATGIIYILSRNLIFSILYSFLYHMYRMTNEIGIFLKNPLIKPIYIIMDEFIVLTSLGIILYFFLSRSRINIHIEWIKTLKKNSYDYIGKGLVGFFIITLLLIFVQFLINHMTESVLKLSSTPSYLFFSVAFYLIAFSIPWWLSISTEYLQDLD